ncbi:hypothetical protein [Burkholderia lata]|uniref:Uncharacterized protein n=1 Tax=Burkholderia lata (strain ATCC 17760 / DSM 23089 / LMG 22485 / NCIMB 9086 / R18194 / 383) TaxID=482957 RepID=A0A6P2GUJ1_BURL3|nr:hypothetical protein [Burkholderia lata]VWB08175.1 hypothetical protein BLA6863_00204 [Burkholderia lata]
MADTTGPISTLPGAHHSVPAGAMCDDHPDRPATHRVQGETDSFGSELNDMCDECYAEYKAAMAETAAERATGRCDWCDRHATDLRSARDYDEGSYGRVYDVCAACRKRQNDDLQEELDRYYD